TVKSVASSSLFFTVSGFTKAVTLKPGQSLPLTLTFSPTNAAAYTGTLDIQLDVLNDTGVSLSGSGTPPTALTVTNLTTLPAATQSAAYRANLVGAGGSSKLSFLLGPGSVLPLGLTMSNAGIISGSLDPSVAIGSYSFSVTLRDNGNHTKTSKVFTL